ncbi:MAG: alpha/beta hydrolase [Bacillota bacterium]|nr:MAG: alpha/beta hydrolase [Bacillota bacterium]
MASQSSKMIQSFLRFFKFNQRLAKEIASPRFGMQQHPKLPLKVIKTYNIETHEVDGQKMYVWHGDKKEHQSVILYIHGGAFVKRQNTMHFNLFKKLVSKTGCLLIAPDYPLVPHAKVDDIYKHLERCYHQARQTYKTKQMILMGDSAGGGLALGLAQRLSEKENIKNQELILISPWLDVSMTHPKVVDIQKEDPILNYQTLKDIGLMYASSYALNDPIVNPLEGTFEGIKHIALWSGTYDILYADAIQLEEKLVKHNIDYEMHIYEKMLHTWIYFGIRESLKAIDEIIQTIKKSEVKR